MRRRQSCYCLSCEYDLGGQVEPRCPECGRGFNPNDPRTFSRHPRRYPRRLWAFVAAAWLGVLCVYPAFEMVLASGYGYPAFGVLRLPHSNALRAVLAYGAFFAVVGALAGSCFVLIRGHWGHRFAVSIPMLASAALLAYALYEMLGG